MLEGLKDIVRDWVGPDPDAVEYAAFPLGLEYSFHDLSSATGGFGNNNRLGAGGAGAVFRGLLRGGTEVAVKVLSNAGDAKGFDEELQVLSRFRHPNIVTLLGWGQHGHDRYLVYELLSGGDVHRRLWKCRHQKLRFSWRHRLRVARDACCGLSHMMNSEPKAFHRDIKTANILMDGYGVAKVADFGLSHMVKRGKQLTVDFICGSPGYSCPVYVKTGRVSEQTEAYSFGIVLLELVTGLSPALPGADGKPVFPLLEMVALEKPGAHNRIMKGLDATGEWPPQFGAEVADLALSCVAAQLDKRPAFEVMTQALRHLCSSSADSDENQPPALMPPNPRRSVHTRELGSGLPRQRSPLQSVPHHSCRSSPTYYGPDASIADMVQVACNGGPPDLEEPCSIPSTSLLERVINGGTLFNTACCTRVNRARADKISARQTHGAAPCMVATSGLNRHLQS
jgi:serine/threonine protein kinase